MRIDLEVDGVNKTEKYSGTFYLFQTLLKAKLLQPLVQLLLVLMSTPCDDEDDEDEEKGGDEMNNLQSVAGQVCW